MVKKNFSVLFLLTIFCLIVSCRKTNEKEKNVVLLMHEVNSSESISGLTGQKFADEVEKISNGTIKIDLRFSGVLGDQKSITNDFFNNKDSFVDIVRLSIMDYSEYGMVKSRLVSIPYTFSSREHFWKFAESPLASLLLSEPYEKDYPVHGIFLGEEGFRHFFSTQKIEKPSDFVNKIIRIPSDPVIRSVVNELGGICDTTSFSALYSALRYGSVDIAEQPVVNYKANFFHEVAPYLILDGHSLGITMTAISDKAWNSLSKKQKGWLLEAGKIAGNYCREISENKDREVLSELKQLGVTVIEVDNTLWKDDVSNTINTNTAIDKDYYNSIINLQY